MMKVKIIDNCEKQNPKIPVINGIIAKSFGKGFKGNYELYGGGITESGELRETNRLGIIGKKAIFFCEKWAGALGPMRKEEDGSTIAVVRQYKKNAEKYAELYEAQMNKEVTVIVVNESSEAEHIADLCEKIKKSTESVSAQ